MDAQQIQDAGSQAQTVAAVLGGLGVFKGAEYLAQLWKERRKTLAEARGLEAEARALEARAEQEMQAAEHGLAREARKDTIAEYAAIIAQKDADIAHRDAAYAAYQQFAHQRLDLASTRILDLHAEKVVTAGQMARMEERLKACEDDRAELRGELNELKGRVSRVEHGQEQ